jgi:hypothetical protein
MSPRWLWSGEPGGYQRDWRGGYLEQRKLFERRSSMTADPTACEQSQLPDPRRMEARIFLADAAQVDSLGKVHALGLGWSTTITPLPAQAVVILIKVPWNQANRAHKLRAELLTQDGQPVTIPGPVGDHPVTIEGDFEAARPPGLPAGTPLDLPSSSAFNKAFSSPAGTCGDCRSTAYGKTAGLRAFCCERKHGKPTMGGDVAEEAR